LEADVTDNEDGYEAALLAIDVLTNITRILQGGMSSPDYPANAKGLLEEIRDEMKRIKDDSNPAYY
jgi:hypothetical protein